MNKKLQTKPYSPACDRNKVAILEVLKKIITPYNKNLLEIGSGTGQHAVFFAPHFKNLSWTTSDLTENHPGIKSWLNEFNIPNIFGPLPLKIGTNQFPKLKFDLVFTANTFHIMSWNECITLIKLLGINLPEDAQVIIYGPFNYDGKFTSQSNEDFDRFLKNQNKKSGIRSFEDVQKIMINNGFLHQLDHEMPANNRILVYTKIDRSLVHS